jgi:hypothetical protein
MLFLIKNTKPPECPESPLCELGGLCEKFSSYNLEKRSTPGCEKKCVSRPFRYRSIQARKVRKGRNRKSQSNTEKYKYQSIFDLFLSLISPLFLSHMFNG